MKLTLRSVPIKIEGTTLSGTSDTELNELHLKELLYQFKQQYLKSVSSQARDYGEVWVKDGIIIGVEVWHGHRTEYCETKIRETTSEEKAVLDACDLLLNQCLDLHKSI